MAFVCPGCDAPTLDIVERVELGPGADDDERTLQRIRCTACGLTGAAEYRESRRGSGESWHHDGCLLDAAGEDALRAWFASPAAERRTIDGVRSIAEPLSWFRMQYVG